MPLEQTEVDKHLEGIHERILSVIETKDIEKILDLFHPHAVVVHRESGVIYGHEDLRQFYQACLKVGPPIYKVIPTKNLATPDGEYLIQEGFLEFNINDEKKRCEFTGIFKRDEQGIYKYYRNEVDVKNMH